MSGKYSQIIHYSTVHQDYSQMWKLESILIVSIRIIVWLNLIWKNEQTEIQRVQIDILVKIRHF